MVKAAAISALACGALAGCSLVTDSFRTNDFSGDPFPIQIGRESGAVLIGVRDADERNLIAVLDILSPLTIIDPGIDMPTTLGTSDLVLLGRAAPDAEAFELPRARLRGAGVLSLHPCVNNAEDPTCYVGAPGAALPYKAMPYDAIVGANVLAGDALRLRLGDDQAFLLADVGGDERDRTFACDAVFPSPYRGGGTLVFAGTEVSFGGRRVTLQACLGADPAQATQTARGGDVLLVASTGIGVSLLSETAYQRYRQAVLQRMPAPTQPPPALADLPGASVYLPSGPIDGRHATIDRLALAAASSSSPRAPCRQVYAHHRLLPSNCDPNVRNENEDCPCSPGDEFCSVPAIVELTPPDRDGDGDGDRDGIEVLVVPDSNATLQALRAELRPDQPEVDGILGADALALAEVDIDYPHNRVLMRCPAPAAPGAPTAGTGCVTRPALADKDDRDRVKDCIDAGAAAAP